MPLRISAPAVSRQPARIGGFVAEAPSPLSEAFRGRLAALPDGEQGMIDWVLRRVVEMMEATEVDASPILTTGDMTADHDDVARFLDPKKDRD